MNTEKVLSTSAVILICGFDFCAIAGDTRLTMYDRGMQSIKSNKFHKVFKLNNNILYGVTGYFDEEDGIGPFVGEYITDKNYYIENAVVEVQKFRKRCSKLPAQTFLLAGKGRPGNFAAAVLPFKQGERECQPDLDVPGNGQCWLRFSVPSMSEQAAEQIIQHKIENTMPFTSLDVLTSHMKNAVKEISKVDKTVNSNIDIFTII